MQTNITRSYKHAIVLGAADINSIVKLLTAEYGKVKLSATCSEGSKFDTEYLDDILQYENPNFRRVNSLEIRAGDPFSEGCSVSVGEGMFSTVSISIKDSDDKRALKVAREVEDRIRECRPFYSILTTVSPATVFTVAAIAWGSFDTWQRILSGQKSVTHTPPLLDSLLLLLPIIVVATFAAGMLGKTWNWLFPRIWVNIGRQQAELQRREKFRGFIFGTICLGLILGVFGNVLTDFLKR